MDPDQSFYLLCHRHIKSNKQILVSSHCLLCPFSTAVWQNNNNFIVCFPKIPLQLERIIKEIEMWFSLSNYLNISLYIPEEITCTLLKKNDTKWGIHNGMCTCPVFWLSVYCLGWDFFWKDNQELGIQIKWNMAMGCGDPGPTAQLVKMEF